MVWPSAYDFGRFSQQPREGRLSPADVEWQGTAANLLAAILFLLGLLWAMWRLHLRGRASPDARQAEDGPENEPYRVFTRAHDVELSAADIPDRLRGLSPFKPAHYAKADAWAAHRNHLRRFEAAQIPVTEVEQTLRAAIADPANLAVCLVIDQSGSMKGAPIAAAASAVRVVNEALMRIGVTTEILGFTTAGWHGGFPREEWLRRGRPLRPGRLCALAHIVYKRADEPEWTEQSRDAFLRPDVLRENIDGEALEWAEARLKQLPAPRKLLILLSDGAPVDDSTLQENGPNYLVRHLRATIARIERERDITLGAVGIEHAVEAWYRNARSAGVTTLSTALTDLIVGLTKSD
jgi:cobaltochelatase CobT